MNYENRDFPLETELKNIPLGKWNKIIRVFQPLGVQVFITTEEVQDIDRAEELSEKIEYMENDVFAEPLNLFLHTIGTSAERLQLGLTAIKRTGVYPVNTRLRELALKSEVENALAFQFIDKLNDVIYDKFDKLINPYEPVGDLIGLSFNNTSLTQLINFDNCDFDMLEITLTPPFNLNDVNGIVAIGHISAKVNHLIYFTSGGYSYSPTQMDMKSSKFQIKNLKNQIFSIEGVSRHILYSGHITIQKYKFKN